jgi:WD40 repeat protein
MYLPQFPQLLSVTSGQMKKWPALLTVLEGPSDRIASLAVSSDGRHIVSASGDHTIRVWDVESGEMGGEPFITLRVTSVAFSPDGKHIVSGSLDKTLFIWDAESGRVVVGPFVGHTEKVNSVGFSPDGKHIVSGSDDRTSPTF